MRIRHQLATAGLALLMTLYTSAGARAAAPSKVEALIAKVRIYTPVPETDATVKEILKLDSASGDAYSMQQWCRFREHKMDEAIDLGKKAIALKFKNIFWMRRANNCLYHCYIEKKDWTQALKYGLLCYKVEQTSGVAHDISILYEKTGNAELSKKYADIAEDISAEQRRAVRQTNNAIKTIKQAEDPKTVDTILDRVNEGLAKNPKDYDAIILRAQCYRTKKLYTKALKDFDTAIAMWPERGVLYYQRARIYKLMGNDRKSAAGILEGKKHGFDLEKFQRGLGGMRARAHEEGTTGSGTPGSRTPASGMPGSTDSQDNLD